MARPREFRLEDVVESAMQVFWSKGYEATSLNDLTRAMGLSKSSFYESFGSKRELFLTTIDHYNDTLAARRARAIIDDAGGGLPGIAAVFRAQLRSMGEDGNGRGCFLNNCAVELGAKDTACARKVATGLARLENEFIAAVLAGQERGDISTRWNAEDLATYLVACLHGLIVLAKADRDYARLDRTVDLILAPLR